jgi:hypothetical protein
MDARLTAEIRPSGRRGPSAFSQSRTCTGARARTHLQRGANNILDGSSTKGDNINVSTYINQSEVKSTHARILRIQSYSPRLIVCRTLFMLLRSLRRKLETTKCTRRCFFEFLCVSRLKVTYECTGEPSETRFFTAFVSCFSLCRGQNENNITKWIIRFYDSDKIHAILKVKNKTLNTPLFSSSPSSYSSSSSTSFSSFSFSSSSTSSSSSSSSSYFSFFFLFYLFFIFFPFIFFTYTKICLRARAT